QYGATNFGPQTVLDEGTAPGKVLVIPMHGVIGAATMFPSDAGISLQKLKNYIEHSKGDEEIVAYLLDVDSPGGSGYVSDEILHYFDSELDKPVYAHFRSMAASGGYYVSCHADKIYIDPTRRTGS
ncbi:MAG: S49 family peptidase, partial [Planctomycetota bacterium]|nr:S49 family peptidase [Planctomycetota bacterium]